MRTPESRARPRDVQAGIRSAQLGMVVNAVLAAIKLVAGVTGNAYALVADAVESTADIIGSLVVWGGLHIAAEPPDEDHPFGHGKAESIAGAVVAVMLLGAGIGIAFQAIEGIRVPHSMPASWTLAVLVGVVVVKWALSRKVGAVGDALASTALRNDAWHHLSDAITSAAAFLGIGIALLGKRLTGSDRWAAADEYAALVAAAVILYNGFTLLLPALHELMDRAPGDDVVGPVRRTAEGVPGVMAVEKLFASKAGLVYRVVIHVQASPQMTLEAAHDLGHEVQRRIIAADPRISTVIVHMEPFSD